MKIQLEHEIEAPQELLFDLLADHSQHTKWNPNMIESRFYEEGPIVKGSKGITIGEFSGRRVENEVYYDVYDRPKYVLGGTTSGTVDAKMSNEFIPTEKGTKIIYKLDVKFKGMMKLVPGKKKILIKQKEEEIKALKEYVAKNK
jgi:hypothetical protein